MPVLVNVFPASTVTLPATLTVPVKRNSASVPVTNKLPKTPIIVGDTTVTCLLAAVGVVPTTVRLPKASLPAPAFTLMLNPLRAVPLPIWLAVPSPKRKVCPVPKSTLTALLNSSALLVVDPVPFKCGFNIVIVPPVRFTNCVCIDNNAVPEATD